MPKTTKSDSKLKNVLKTTKNKKSKIITTYMNKKINTQTILSKTGIEMSRNSVISKKYQKKSHLEHIKERPDTYIGSCEKRTECLWVMDGEKMVHRDVTFVPGFLKIFDEILVNAADNKRRDSSMKSIKVTICNDRISVENDGQGIPVVMHETEKMYVPQMVFGELLSGDNYDDSSDRVVGGRNGYGAKLANIFSTIFCVETIDSKAGKKYSQSWHGNMSKVDTPKTI